jgi:transcriptional regulator with XRE-family HTH domain
MTAVQDARAALGERLRELRRDAGLTGRQLAESLSWPASKVSKLENGRQQPTDADIRGWTEATGRADATEALLASLHTLEEQHAQWQRLLRRGLRAQQDTITARDARTRMFRAFEPTVIPGLLQTPDYARARFEQSVRMHRLTDDVDEAVRARMRRQEILYRADKRFHLVLTEATLRYSLCPTEVMLGQLDRLIALAALPTVRLGVIGFGTPCSVAPLHGFWLFDDDSVAVESYSAKLTLAQPQEIELYTWTFDALAADASYGRAARAIITAVIDDLAAATAADGD